MNERIDLLLNQIRSLENESQTALNKQQSKIFFQIKG